MPCQCTVYICLSLPDGRPPVDVEPGLVLWVEAAQVLGEALAHRVVVLRQERQAPLRQLVSVVNLKEGKWLCLNGYIFSGRPATVAESVASTSSKSSGYMILQWEVR